jgi:hypothetical protein
MKEQKARFQTACWCFTHATSLRVATPIISGWGTTKKICKTWLMLAGNPEVLTVATQS